jgi:retron-type reverse transcriptase
MGAVLEVIVLSRAGHGKQRDPRRPVKRQETPKSGGGVRELGIPCVLDRFVQQAILQVLQPRFDPTFSEHSHGFRPGRRAHDAVCEAQQYIQEGRRVVVDVDLEKFFDRVNHDVLMGKLAGRIADKRMLGLRRLCGRLRLRINEAKSAVGRPWDRKFLGYRVWVVPGRKVKRRVAPKALTAMKDRVREITARNGGRSMRTVIAELRAYLRAGKSTFGSPTRPT